jgi:chromosomal replication initiation ATPase DnaA
MTPRVKSYAEEISFWHDVPVEQVLSKSRFRKLAYARGDIMRRLRADGFSTPQIGAWLGKDHSTVIHWLQKPADVG